jgi:hypothetical protein
MKAKASPRRWPSVRLTTTSAGALCFVGDRDSLGQGTQHLRKSGTSSGELSWRDCRLSRMTRVEERRLAKRHLPEAEKLVGLGRKHIFHQQRIIEELRNVDQDTIAAEQLLNALVETQMLHEEHRDQLRRDLGLA